MRIALLESLTFGFNLLDEAAERLGARLTLLTRDESMYRAELPLTKNIDVVSIDTFDEEALFEYLHKQQFDGLFSNTDTWTEIGSRLQERLGLPGRSSALSTLLRDKAAVRAALMEAKLSTVSSLEVPGPGEVASLISKLPLIIKPKHGTASRDIYVAANAQEFERIVQELHTRGDAAEFIMEPYLTGPMYSAESLIHEGQTNTLGLSNRGMSRWPDFREEWGLIPCAPRGIL